MSGPPGPVGRRTVRDERIGLALEVPEAWTDVPQAPDEDGFAPLVLTPEQWPEEHGFRPSIVVVASAPDEPAASAPAVGSEALASALAMTDSRVLAYDLWLLGEGAGTAEGLQGRRLVFTYLLEQTTVCVTQYVVVHGGRAITLTASVDTDRYLRVQAAVEQAVASLVLTGPGVAGGRTSASEPRPEPRRDAFWTSRGEDLEDLDRVAEQQPWEASGPVLPRAAVEVLARAASGRVKARTLEEPGRDTLRLLEEADLLDGRGRPSEAGRRVAQVVARAEHHVRVEATTGLVPLTFDAWSLGAATVVFATESPAALAGHPHSGTEIAVLADRVRLTEVPTGWLPVAVHAWLGLGPAWSADLSPARLPMATVTARVDDPGTALPQGLDGADDLLREVWRHDWVLWSVQASGSSAEDRGLIGLGTGSTGQFALRRVADDPDDVHLRAWPAASLWESLVALCLE